MKRLFVILSLFLLICRPCWGGILCDGSDDTIDISSVTDIAGAVAFTVAIKTKKTTGGSKIMYDSSSGTNAGIRLGVASGGEMNGVKGGVVVFGSTLVLDNGVNYYAVWTHAASGSDNITYYRYNLDTDSMNTENDTQTSSINAGTGAAEICVSSYNGEISSVAVWNVELTAVEVDLLVKSKVKRMELQIQPDNLTEYWALDEVVDGVSADGVTLRDLSGTGSDGVGDDGANNTGLTGASEKVLSYPHSAISVTTAVAAVGGGGGGDVISGIKMSGILIGG